MRKYFFIQGIVKDWNSLLSDIISSAPVQWFQKQNPTTVWLCSELQHEFPFSVSNYQWQRLSTQTLSLIRQSFLPTERFNLSKWSLKMKMMFYSVAYFKNKTEEIEMSYIPFELVILKILNKKCYLLHKYGYTFKFSNS